MLIKIADSFQVLLGEHRINESSDSFFFEKILRFMKKYIIINIVNLYQINI